MVGVMAFQGGVLPQKLQDSKHGLGALEMQALILL